MIHVWVTRGMQIPFIHGHTDYQVISNMEAQHIYPSCITFKAILNVSFVESFMALNSIINFADMIRREKKGVSWNVRGVLSPWNLSIVTPQVFN